LDNDRGKLGFIMIENKLGITNSSELMLEEERITKHRARELFDNGILDTYPVGTFKGLSRMLS